MKRYDWCNCHPAHRRRKVFGRLLHPGYFEQLLCEACYWKLRQVLTGKPR